MAFTNSNSFLCLGSLGPFLFTSANAFELKFRERPTTLFWASSLRLNPQDDISSSPAIASRSRKRRNSGSFLFSDKDDNNDLKDKKALEQKSQQYNGKEQEEELSDEELLHRELQELEAYEEFFKDLDLGEDDDYDIDMEHEDRNVTLWDNTSLEELLKDLDLDKEIPEVSSSPFTADPPLDIQRAGAASLEKALLQGVVPVSAGVGSDVLPGDFGFDPLNLASKDYFKASQDFLLTFFPKSDIGIELIEPKKVEETEDISRPKALILRDYREAEIRHSRLAMLAAVFWPLQEMLDNFVLDEDQVGPLIYGPVTLPFFPLLMTGIMLLLGYLDIYSQSIKDMDRVGEAFTPGDCFWDPLRILEGAPASMKRNMQERELFNGRAAMIAFASFAVQEAATGKPLAAIGSNALLLEPAYEIPAIQHWLDDQFSTFDSASVMTDIVN